MVDMVEATAASAAMAVSLMMIIMCRSFHWSVSRRLGVWRRGFHFAR
jgi:hypothetical protein